MPPAEEKTWGSVKGGNQVVDTTDAPSVKRAPTTSVRLEDLDFDLLELGTEVKKGSAGDSFLELKYGGSRLCLTFGELKPDKLVNTPFKAGPPKTKDGMPLGDAWSMSVEITPEQVKKYGEFEAWLIKNVKKFKHALPQPKAKAGKTAKELTDEEFENKLNSLVQPENHEKGWKAKFRVAVQHVPVDSNGNSRQMPTINITHQKDGGFTRPRKGSVNDLEKNSAVVIMCGLSRGVYIGNTGWRAKAVEPPPPAPLPSHARSLAGGSSSSWLNVMWWRTCPRRTGPRSTSPARPFWTRRRP